MPKTRTQFVCRSCGGVHGRWLGKCPDCGAWDSLEEHRVEKRLAAAGVSAADVGLSAAVPISEARNARPGPDRLPTGIAEIDRVLGGSESGRGLVPGSAVLIGGEPGIGKSTLLLQAAGAWAADADAPVLYVSAEESAEQVAGRAERLGVGDRQGLYVLAETSLSRMTEQARQLQPAVIIIDSIQMIEDPEADATPGSIAQLRRAAGLLVTYAKVSGTAVVLVGHVTKDGQLAGPRVLEHIVDAVLSFEGDRFHAGRVLRALKNRFGTTAEVGLFEMSGQGLIESDARLSAAAAGDPRPGSVVCPALHGTRSMLVEVQALTATGFLGAAKRKSSGLDAGRLSMIIAVLEQHAGLRLADRDVFASVVGGVRIVEPASDLPLLLAIAGAHHGRALPPSLAVVGEVGLGGEVRPVSQLEARAAEAVRMGFERIIVPKGSKIQTPGARLDPVASVGEAIERLG
ncbi:MAG: DNA repair protein RadA [Planctomycetota bacterium]